MRNIKTFVAILAICVLSFSFTPSYAGSNPFLIVRVIECQGGDSANESMILIDRGTGEIEVIKLDKFHKKNFKKNFEIIAKTLNKVKAEGYSLVGTSGGGGNDNAMILQNYIFEKE